MNIIVILLKTVIVSKYEIANKMGKKPSTNR